MGVVSRGPWCHAMGVRGGRAAASETLASRAEYYALLVYSGRAAGLGRVPLLTNADRRPVPQASAKRSGGATMRALGAPRTRPRRWSRGPGCPWEPASPRTCSRAARRTCRGSYPTAPAARPPARSAAAGGRGNGVRPARDTRGWPVQHTQPRIREHSAKGLRSARLPGRGAAPPLTSP